MKIVRKLMVVFIAFLFVFNTCNLPGTYKVVLAAINTDTEPDQPVATSIPAQSTAATTTDTEPAQAQPGENLFTSGSPLNFEEGKSYVIKNQSSHFVTVEFERDSEIHFDLVKYSADEKIIQFEKDYSWNIGLEAGESVRITPKGNLKGSIPNAAEEEVFVSESEEPALSQVTLEKNKHYEIRNTSDSTILLKNVAIWDKKVEIVGYDSAGQVRFIENQWWGDLWLNQGEYVRLSVNPDQTQEAYLPYEQKDFVEIKESTPALYHFTLEKGKNYEIRNVSDTSYQMKNIASWDNKAEIVGYDPEGQVRFFEKAWWGDLWLNKGEYVRLSVNSDQTQEAYLPYDQKDFMEIKESNPALYHFTLEKGKNYEIRNTSATWMQLKELATWEKRAEMVVYDREGQVRNFEKGWYGDLWLNEGEKVRFSVNPEESQEAYIPYDQKDTMEIKESNPALYHFTLEKGKNYEIQNTSASWMQLKELSTWEKRAEVVVYDREGQVKDFDNVWYGNLWLNEEEKVQFSVNPDQTQEAFIPYDQKDFMEIKESADPALYHFTLEKNKNYEIRNTGDSYIRMNNLSTWEKRAEVVMYDQAGNIRDFDNVWYGNLWLGNGEKVRLSVNPDQTQEAFLPYSQKDFLEIKESDPALYHFTLEKNKHYEIKNTSHTSIRLNNLASWEKRTDIVWYNQAGKVSDFSKDWWGSLWLNEGEKVRLSVNPDQSQEAFIPYDQKDMFTMKESDPALYKFTLDPDKNYKVMNYSGEEVRIATTSDYNFRFQVLKYDANANYELWDDHYGNVYLGDKEYFFASYAPQEDNKLVFYYPYDQFHNGVIIRESNSEYEDYFDILPKIKLNISKTLSKTDSESETTKIDDSLKNYNFTIKNITKDNQVHDYFIKDNYIVFAKDSVDASDELNIKVESKNHDTESKEVNLTLDPSSQGESNLSILELGKIRVSENNPQKNVPMTRTLIFNEQGTIVDTNSSVSGETIQSMPLQAGNYTVVLLKANGELWRMDQLSDLKDRELVEGTDYLNYPIQVTNGKISTIHPNSIPVLDEDRISFFDRKSTIFTTNTETVVQGGLLEVRLQYQFKPNYNEKNILSPSLNVTIPNEVAFIDNSVMVDGAKANYTVSRGQDQISVPVKKMNGTLKFFVRPVESKLVQLRAMANFTFQNKNLSEVLGTTNVNVNYVTINGPKETNSKDITVTGIAPPNTKLSIYDETTKIGETVVQASGKWSKQVTLANAYLGTTHTLFAKTTDQNPEKQSNPIKVSYLYKAPALKSATLIHNGASKDISNAFLKGEKPVVTINPSKSFTFKIVMVNGEAIDKMYISSSRNQEKKLLEATYDKTTGSWIASGYFDPANLGYVPGALNIEYTTKKEKVDLNAKIDFTKEEYVNALPESFKNAKVDVVEKTDTTSRTVFELADSEKTKIEMIHTQKAIPNDVTGTTLLNQGYTKISDGVYASFKVTDDKIFQDTYDLNSNVEEEVYFAALGNIPLVGPISSYFGIQGDIIGLGGDVIDAALLGDKILNNPNLTAAEKKKQLDQLAILGSMNVVYNSFRIASTVMELAGVAGPPGLVVAVAWFAADQLFEFFYTNSMKSLEENGSMFAWLIDPSGYVYEALPENRLRGVKVTVYYKDPNTGQVLKWNAEDYEQLNPLLTNDSGEYAWDVPEGLWQVKYELEGYETMVSEWLPVPPPQTTVNIGMVSKKKPEVKVFNLFKDQAEVVFEKYMEVDSVNLSSISLKDPKGKNIVQSVEAVDSAKADSGKILSKKFIIHYVPATTFALNAEYQLEVKNSVKTYAQVSPDQTIVVKAKYTAVPQNIIAQDTIDISYGKTTRIPIHVSDVTNASGVKIQVESTMKELVEPVESTVALDAKGEAFVSLRGNLPGQATLRLTIVGTDVTKEINVNVLSVGTSAPNQKPTISASDVIINVGDRPDWLKGVAAYDQEDGNLTDKIKITQNTVNTTKAGIYKISYAVTDSDGLTGTKEITVTVKELPNQKPTITAKDLSIFVGDKPNWLKDVTAFDKEDGSLTSKIKIVQNTVNTSKPGVYKIIYSVSDKKGLTTTKEIKVTVKKIIYPKLIVSPLDDNDRIVTGQTDIGVKLSTIIGKKTYVAAIDKAGKFKIVNIPVQKANAVVVITAVDKYSHKTIKTIKVLDKTPPKLPSLSKVSTKTTLLKGNTEAYGNVYLTVGKQKWKLTASSKGAFSKKISKLKKGTTIRIYVVDRAGNKSKELVVKVK